MQSCFKAYFLVVALMMPPTECQAKPFHLNVFFDSGWNHHHHLNPKHVQRTFIFFAQIMRGVD